jgi:hypothetical protein
MVVSSKNQFNILTLIQYSAILLLTASFVLPVLAAPSMYSSQVPDIIYGWKAFLSGLIQLIFICGVVIQLIINAVLSFNIVEIYSAMEMALIGIPVLANFTFICSLVNSYKQQNRHAISFAILTVLLMVIFLLHHQALVGPDISIMDIEPLLGAYIWAASGGVLFLSCCLSFKGKG